MSKTVWRMTPVNGYDIPGLEAWLSAMAAKGLHLVKIGEFFACFTSGPSQEGVRYALDVKDWADIDPERNDLYEQAGWEYVTTFKGLYYVYRTRNPDALPLHTDPVTQSFTFDRLLRRRLWTLILLIPLVLFMLRDELSAFFHNPWSPVYLFFLKTEGCCLYLLLVAFYIVTLVPLFRQRRALKALQKQLANGTPLSKLHFRPRRIPYALIYGTPLILMVCAIVVFIWKNPHRAQALPAPEDWNFPYVTLEQVLEGTDMFSLTLEESYDSMLHWPTLRHSLLVPEQIHWSQYGEVVLKDGSSQECGIVLNLYRLRFPDLAPLLLRCVQEEDLAWWHRYEKNIGELYMNPELVELQSFRPVETSAFDELTVLTWRTADMETSQNLYMGRAGGLVFTLTCSAPADISRTLDIFAKEVSS